MNFAVCSNTHRCGRILFVAGLLLLSACGGKGPEEKLRILGSPTAQAFLGAEYKYELGIDGGDGIPTVSLTDAPRWMSAEYVDNAARKGVVIRGVPGISGGGAGEADLTGREPIQISLTVYEGNESVTMTFPLVVYPNDLSVAAVEVTEGNESKVPTNSDGEPETDCLVKAPGELGEKDTVAYVPVQLTSPSVRKVVASFETRAGGSVRAAQPGDDFLDHRGKVTFEPGTTLCYVEVIILDDELAEDTESLELHITSVDEGVASFAKGGEAKATITIHDNEPQVSWNTPEVVITEGMKATVKAFLDQAVDRLVTARFELATGSDLTTADIVVEVEGNVLTSPYLVEFQPGEKEKEIVIEVLDDQSQQTGPDKQFGLAWQRTLDVREQVDALKVYVNELVDPITLPLEAGVTVRELLTDKESNIYVAYSGSEPGQEGIVEVFDRHGRPLTAPVVFAGGAHSTFKRELVDIFIREYEVASGQSQNTRYVDLFMVGTVEGNLAGQKGGTDVLVDVWRWEGTGNFKPVSPWPRQFGTQYDDAAHAIYVDDSHHIYIVGETKGRFDGGAASGAGDAFLVKFNETGDLLFANNVSGISSQEVLTDITGNGTGRVTVTGYAVGQLYGTPQGGKDVVVASYNREGRIQRGRQQGNMEDNVATTVALMNNSGILNGGYTQGLLFKTAGSHHGGEDAFVSFFPDASTHGSTVQFGSAGDDRVLDVVTDGNRVFATGYASGVLFPGCSYAGGKDAFLVSYKVVPTRDDVNHKDEVLMPAWEGDGCPEAGQKGWPIQTGTSDHEQGSKLAITPSRKLLWLVEREVQPDEREVEITPYNLDGHSLLP